MTYGTGCRGANVTGLPSLYQKNATRAADPKPEPFPPGTIKTASIETIDNDVARLLLDAGVVR